MLGAFSFQHLSIPTELLDVEVQPLHVEVEVADEQANLVISVREANEILETLCIVDDIDHAVCLRIGECARKIVPFDAEIEYVLRQAHTRLPLRHPDRFSGLLFELSARERVTPMELDRRRYTA